MSAVIIGIHGLGNKPPYKTMAQWWIKSIREGFYVYGYPVYSFNFDLAFWADIVYPVLLDPEMTNKKDPTFDTEPYIRALNYEPKEPNSVKRKMLDFLEKKMDKAFEDARLSYRLETLTSVFIHNFFKELDIYFSEKMIHNKNANELIKDRLIRILRKHQGDRILLIAHSMGSIVAYDVLRQLSGELKIDTFVTMGSPLGLPFIKNKFVHSSQEELDQDPVVKAPDAIQTNWFNLSDLDDKVAVNYNLADDYIANSRGIGVTDLVVSNNYEIGGQKNHHKVFGYLRTPEMADILYEFVSQDRSRIQKGIDRVLYHGGKFFSGYGW
jgi:hypothetical protein